MPAVNGVGEPCAGERPARFEAAGVGNGAKNLATVTGVAQPTGNRRKKGPRPYRGRSHRASSRPYRERRIRARLARRRTKSLLAVCNDESDNAATRDAGRREPDRRCSAAS